MGEDTIERDKNKPQRFDPKEAIERTENLLEGHRHQKNITIATHIPDNVSIHTDRDKFDFIIRNLLSNAIKFSNTGGHIEVSASLVRDEIVFSVKDNGVGLTEEQRQQFITQGLQSGTGTAGEKGTGLGLLLIKDFIQSAGGRIWVQSEPGAGATFSFTLGNTK